MSTDVAKLDLTVDDTGYYTALTVSGRRLIRGPFNTIGAALHVAARDVCEIRAAEAEKEAL